MRNQIKLSPKTKTTVAVKNSILYASVGVGIFILVFTGAFFYLNMGNSEKVVAAPTTKKANAGGGDWNSASTWTPSGKPGNGDVIEIPGGVTITIPKTPEAINLTNIELKIFGTLSIAGSLILDPTSKVLIDEDGDVISSGPGNSERLIIGNYTWKGNEFEAQIPSPGTLTKDGATNESLLPIVLDYFTAKTTASNSVLIEWGTVSEKENDFFNLERSADGKIFETITTVKGAGNSNQKLKYSFEDHKSSVGMNYYRLKQTDYNGDFEYFRIVGVNNTTGSSTVSTTIESFKVSEAYPNPFKGEINLAFQAEVNGDVEILIQNARGEIVHKEMVPTNIGENNYRFSKADHLQPGVYYINLWNNGKKYKPQRLIKI